MRVTRTGKALVVELPDEVVEALELQDGDEVDVRAIGHNLVEVRPNAEADALIAQLRSLRGKMPPDFRFDRDEANER